MGAEAWYNGGFGDTRHSRVWQPLAAFVPDAQNDFSVAAIFCVVADSAQKAGLDPVGEAVKRLPRGELSRKGRSHQKKLPERVISTPPEGFDTASSLN